MGLLVLPVSACPLRPLLPGHSSPGQEQQLRVLLGGQGLQSIHKQNHSFGTLMKALAFGYPNPGVAHDDPRGPSEPCGTGHPGGGLRTHLSGQLCDSCPWSHSLDQIWTSPNSGPSTPVQSTGGKNTPAVAAALWPRDSHFPLQPVSSSQPARGERGPIFKTTPIYYPIIQTGTHNTERMCLSQGHTASQWHSRTRSQSLKLWPKLSALAQFELNWWRS